MSELTLLLWAASVAAAYWLGSSITERTDRRLWERHRYCPTCDRLSTEQEIDSIGMDAQ